MGSSDGSYDPTGTPPYFGDTTSQFDRMKISPADERLLSLLREDARASTAQIARRLGLSRTTVQSRIDRLERQGVIAGYTVRVHEAYEAGCIRAHIMVTVAPRHMTGVVKALQAIPEVRELHSVSGPFDLMALGVVASVEEMDVLTDRIGSLDGVERTTSAIILSTKFDR
jgi:DNA-binding Lrp family transcriptional regulator